MWFFMFSADMGGVREHSDSNENAPFPRLSYLNKSPVGSVFSEMFRRYDLLKEVCCRKSKGLSPLPVVSIICFGLAVADESSQLPVPGIMPFAVMMDFYLPGIIGLNKPFLL